MKEKWIIEQELFWQNIINYICFFGFLTSEAKRSNSEESPFMVSRASDSQESTKQLRCLKSPLQGGSNEIAAKVT